VDSVKAIDPLAALVALAAHIEETEHLAVDL